MFRLPGILLTLFLIVPNIAVASAGRSSFVFLRIGSGSRPVALAEAVTASGDDITSTFYNPALLQTFSGKSQAVFMYNSYFNDVSQNYLGLASKGDNFAVGGYLALGKVANFERRDDRPTTTPLGNFDENNFIGALILSCRYSRVDAGIAFKYAYEKIDYSSASAIMFDAGLRTPLNDEVTIGGAVKNIGTKPKFENNSYPLPQEYRLGLSYQPASFQNAVEFMADVVFYSDIDSKYNFGAEYKHKRYFALRAGYGAGYDSRGLSIGGGLFYRTFRFDYAFVTYKNNLGNAHRFTVIAGF